MLSLSAQHQHHPHHFLPQRSSLRRNKRPGRCWSRAPTWRCSPPTRRRRRPRPSCSCWTTSRSRASRAVDRSPLMSEFRFLPMIKRRLRFPGCTLILWQVMSLTYSFSPPESLKVKKILQHILLLSRVKQLQGLNQNAKVLGQKSLSDDLLSDQILWCVTSSSSTLSSVNCWKIYYVKLD